MNRANERVLTREVGLWDLALFNIVAVVGIRWLAAAAHSGPGSLGLWLLAAIFFFIPSALAVAALSERNPGEGGIYLWACDAFGPWHGFLCGWCYWLSNMFYFPNLLLAGLGMASYALTGGEDRTLMIWGSLALLWIVLIANLVGVASGKWTENLGGAATYLTGLILVGAGAAVWFHRGSATVMNPVPVWNADLVNFWPQIAFAFAGLELGAVMGGEIRNPARSIPRAAWIASGAIVLFYLAGTSALLAILPAAEISPYTGLLEAARAAGSVLGIGWLLPAVAILVSVGVGGQAGAWLAGSARVPFAIGLDRHLPPAFARIHPRWGTPYVAILVQGCACTVFLLALQAGESLTGFYQLLVDLTVVTYFIPFLYLFGAAWQVGHRLSAAAGLMVTILALVLSAIPPAEAVSPVLFVIKIVGGTLLLVASAGAAFLYGNRKIRAAG